MQISLSNTCTYCMWSENKTCLDTNMHTIHSLTLRDVSTRMVEAPQFWMRVRGMTSRAWATARYGHCSTPVRARERSISLRDTAISTAPPPGSRHGSSSTLRHTCIASCRLRSTSWDTKHTHFRTSRLKGEPIKFDASPVHEFFSENALSNVSHRQDLFAGSSQQDSASFGVFALSDKGEILITDFLNLKQACPCSHIFLT